MTLSRYFKEDIIDPPVVARNGFIKPPKSKGLGVRVELDALEKYTQRFESFKRE